MVSSFETKQQTIAAQRSTYTGLFVIALATLMYEILLTRIFSVTLWYHFAFMAISIAMFGLTVGGMIVYLSPFFTEERVSEHLSLSALSFSGTLVLSFLLQLLLPFVDDASTEGVLSAVVTFSAISVPFVCSGICICLALTKFPGQVSTLYAADLAGAATGCLLLIPTLNVVDGPSAVFVVACLVCLGALCFAKQTPNRRLHRISLTGAILLGSFAIVNATLSANHLPLVRLTWVKGKVEGPALYEKWNSFSRIRIVGNPFVTHRPLGWGLSSTLPKDKMVSELPLFIDGSGGGAAGTVLTYFDGDLRQVEHLKYDLTNLAHYVRPKAAVLVIGVGGGRDILSALAFKQPSIEGVEINQNIIDAVNGVFGPYTGHLDRYRQVRFVTDEARSYLASSQRRFDIIQISLIDTFAATAAGAFVLTENSLYTVEAWKMMINHLTPSGVLSVSRWYFKKRPGEMYRLVALASTTLNKIGITDPRSHIVLVAQTQGGWGGLIPDGIGTLLVGREPFSTDDLSTIEKFAKDMRFTVVLSPRFAMNNDYAALASGKNLNQLISRFPINIAAPTDDSPYFFHMLRLKDMFNQELWNMGIMSFNMKAVYVLGSLVATVTVLIMLCIFVPLLLTADKASLIRAWPLLFYFAGIGLGFMFIEIAQMQRLIVFLGHPVYSLSTVLFTLLLSSGLGSFTTLTVGRPGFTGSALIRLATLLIVVVVCGALTPLVASVYQGATTMVRILVAVGMLFPMGLFMGMAFPIGMKIAGTSASKITPWLWGINGAMSVWSSVLAVALALTFNISTAYWTGVGSYVMAIGAFLYLRRRHAESS